MILRTPARLGIRVETFPEGNSEKYLLAILSHICVLDLLKHIMGRGASTVHSQSIVPVPVRGDWTRVNPFPALDSIVLGAHGSLRPR